MVKLRKPLNPFELRDNTLSRDVKANPADRITLEIGDSKEPNQFIPQAKVSRWDNEVNLSVRRVKPVKGVPIADVRGNHAVFEDDDEEVHIYEKPEIGEDGGLEIELHLKSKPTTNRFDFSIRTKGLDFHYQPALTPEEIANGDIRPNNVIGSYAVYHSTKRDNLVGGKEYKTGKFCHIYRPHVTDADGKETWGELEIDVEAETLTVVVPQKFLATATYPVRVDPTFGYTSVGGSAVGVNINLLYAHNNFLCPEDGSVTEINPYCSSNNPFTLRGVLYNNANALVTFGDEIVGSFKNGFFLSLPVAHASVAVGTRYRPACWQGNSNTYFTRYDSVSGQQHLRRNTTYNSINAPPDPYSVSSSNSNRQYSIYVTYELPSSGTKKGFMAWL